MIAPGKTWRGHPVRRIHQFRLSPGSFELECRVKWTYDIRRGGRDVSARRTRR
jgi:hypothetical protein